MPPEAAKARGGVSIQKAIPASRDKHAKGKIVESLRYERGGKKRLMSPVFR
jgi:hypothetical protein